MTRNLPIAFVLALAPTVGCSIDDTSIDESSTAVEGRDDLGEAAQAAVCPDVSGTNVRRSLAVNDAAILAKFSFKRTMDRIRVTSKAGLTPSTTALFQQWMGTFGNTAATGNCTSANVDPNDYGLVCPRTPEAKLAAIDPFAAGAAITFQPVALMNRLDLAPTNGANCGEYRIVYAMNGSTPDVFGRGFLIFEATLPNPRPQDGVDACLPVARFWQGLTADADVASRATKLEKFYFTGGAVAGFPAVVNAAHYGFSDGTGAPRTAGQIRTNMFIDFAEWQLREFKLTRTCTDPLDAATCRVRFQHAAVRSNPAEELFAGTHARSADFRTHFANLVPHLRSPDVNLLKLPTSNTFNEFESSAQAGNVVYKSFENAAMRNTIQTKLTSMNSALTVDNVLDRATTQTCGGCHQLSNGQALGGGATWPSSLGFVHVDEARTFSSALTGTFLPFRKTVLEKFINDRCTPAGGVAAPADDGLTLGGAPVGSPN